MWYLVQDILIQTEFLFIFLFNLVINVSASAHYFRLILHFTYPPKRPKQKGYSLLGGLHILLAW
jgi:hypothetical protein